MRGALPHLQPAGPGERLRRRNKEVMEYPVAELKFKPKRRKNSERLSAEEYKALEALEDKGGKSKFDD